MISIHSQKSAYCEKKALNPLLKFGQICCVCVPKIFETDKIPRWFKVYTIAVLLSIMSCSIWSAITKALRYEQYEYYSIFLFDIITGVIMTLITLLCIFWAVFFKEKNIRKYLKKLMELDCVISTDNEAFQSRRRKILVFELVIAHVMRVFLLLFDVFANGISFDWDWAIINITYSVFEYILCIQVLHICNYILSLKYKLAILNKSLINFVQNFQRKLEIISKPKFRPPTTILGKYFEAHNKLCNLIDMANDCFGLQILGILFLGVINNTYTVFLILTYSSGLLLPDQDVSVFYILFLYILYSVMYMLFGVMITVSCTSSAKAARRTAAICYKLLLNVDISPKTVEEELLRKELLLFAEQVNQRQIEFNAGGFLNIDYNTLYTLFGSTAMNVIILLQFQKQANNKTIQ